MINWPNKDPDEVLNYGFIWAAELAEGDTILSSTWIVPSGITKVSDGNDDDRTVIKISGGTEGDTYEFTNRIVTTVSGETLDQSAKFKVKSR